MKKTKIGIGITTTQTRPNTYRLCLHHFLDHSKNVKHPDNFEFTYHIQMFYPKKHNGIAAVKNECLKNLEHCDFIFLFDDDCFPIRHDWYLPFLEAHLRTKQHHLLYLVEDYQKIGANVGRRKINNENGLDIFQNSQGCMVFITSEVLKHVGGFDTRFGLHGYEHEQYSIRIKEKGLNTMGTFMTVENVTDYIYSLDVQGVKKEWIPKLKKEYNPKTQMIVSAAKMIDMIKSHRLGAIEWEKEWQIYFDYKK